MADLHEFLEHRVAEKVCSHIEVQGHTQKAHSKDFSPVYINHTCSHWHGHDLEHGNSTFEDCEVQDGAPYKWSISRKICEIKKFKTI